MTGKTVAMAINASWNIFNFRAGLIRGLQEAGHSVVAMSPKDAYVPALVGLGVDHVPVAMDSAGLSPLHDLALLIRYRRALKRIRPDVFLAYTAKPNVWGSLAAQSLGIPVVNNVSGLGTAFIRGGLLKNIVSTLYRTAFRRSATVFFQNPEDLDLFVKSGLVRPDSAALLPGSGIDLTRFSPRAEPPEPRAPTFLLVGRLLWDKGIGEYIEAARMVRQRRPDARFHLLGFLDAQNRTAIPAEQVARWEAEGIVEYLGHAEDVRDALAGADCVVLPSYREGLPRTLLEAAAMGKPLIATDVPGCRHVVDAGVNGFLCEARDPTSLSEAMLRMLDLETGARTAMGAAARRKVEEEFDERRVIDLYLEAIREATAAR